METISYEHFASCKIKIGRIISAARIPGSEKLLKLLIDIGDEKRHIVSGIGKRYAPEILEGKDVAILINLEARSLMGVVSEGMLLAADGEEGPVLLIPESKVSPGSAVK